LWKVAGNEAASRLAVLRAACEASGKEPGSPAALHALGQALASCGWIEEAASVLLAAVRAGSAGSEPLLDAALRNLEFVRRLRAYLYEGYRTYIRSDETDDLEHVLAGIGAISREVLGEDLGTGNPVRSVFPLGEILDPTAPGESALLRYFDRFGQHLILGKRRGHPPEAVLMAVTFRNRSAPADPSDPESRMDLVAGEDFAIESLGEYLGGSLLGVALVGHLFVNLDKVWDREGRLRRDLEEAKRARGRLARFGSWRARDQEERLALDTGAGLREALLLADAAGRPEAHPDAGEALRVAFEEVVVHESTHVRDAARYVPVMSHPISTLSLGLRHGFSPVAIEAALEERAALAVLARSGRPHVELATLAEFAPYPEAMLPHSRGYCRLLRRILAHVDDHPDLYPSVDRERNLCRQLHRLSADEIRGIARALAGEEGIRD
ncbi:MAG: hypothetical protein MUC63_06480, partial [Planctomycetes bacterium]|nr:hypothetical protein [Planctomycetota bacterium]